MYTAQTSILHEHTTTRAEFRHSSLYEADRIVAVVWFRRVVPLVIEVFAIDRWSA